jgi:serine/threonine protein kinase
MGHTVGTPQYMSPEQAIGRPDIDRRSDLWSLALVTYELLTGTHPFKTIPAGQDFRDQLFNARITPPSALRPELPSELDAWMAQALSRPRTARFQSAARFAQAFDAAAAHDFDEGVTLIDVSVRMGDGSPANRRVRPRIDPDANVSLPAPSTGGFDPSDSVPSIPTPSAAISLPDAPQYEWDEATQDFRAASKRSNRGG